MKAGWELPIQAELNSFTSVSHVHAPGLEYPKTIRRSRSLIQPLRVRTTLLLPRIGFSAPVVIPLEMRQFVIDFTQHVNSMRIYFCTPGLATYKSHLPPTYPTTLDITISSPERRNCTIGLALSDHSSCTMPHARMMRVLAEKFLPATESIGNPLLRRHV